MNAAKAFLLFVIGLFLILMAFPTAWSVSAALGYAFDIIAIAFGVYMISERGKRKLPLVLGSILVVLGVVVLLGIATIHMTAYVLEESLKEAVKGTGSKTVMARVGESINIGDWEITVLDVKEAPYIVYEGVYYGPKDLNKLILIKVRVTNVGNKAKSLSEIWGFTLVTDAHKSYPRAYIWNLNVIWNPTDEVKAEAVPYDPLDTAVTLVPGTMTEGDLLFQIPVDEEPVELYFKVGIIGSHEVIVELG